MKSSLALYERSPGRWYWQLSWYEDGKRKQLKRGGFPNRRDARRAGEAEEAKLRARAWRSETNDTLAAWSETWLGSLVVIGRKRSTINGYHRQLDTYVLPRLGGRKLAEIDTVSLDKLYAELLALGGRDGRALSARTVRFVHSILHKMFHDAVRKGLLAQNPAAYASAPSSKAARAPEATVWTPEELFAFLDASREDYYWPMWWTIAFTGLRRAEVCGLRWCDVDLDAGMLEVAVTYNRIEGETYEDTTKSEQSERTVDIDAATVAVLRSWRARQAEIRLMVGTGWKDSGRVFCAPDGAAIRPDTLTKAWPRALRNAGARKIRLHDLRHTHATHQLSVNAITARSPIGSGTRTRRSRCGPTCTRSPARNAPTRRPSRPLCGTLLPILLPIRARRPLATRRRARSRRSTVVRPQGLEP